MNITESLIGISGNRAFNMLLRNSLVIFEKAVLVLLFKGRSDSILKNLILFILKILSYFLGNLFIFH